jgi:hypothetical protein
MGRGFTFQKTCRMDVHVVSLGAMNRMESGITSFIRMVRMDFLFSRDVKA